MLQVHRSPIGRGLRRRSGLAAIAGMAAVLWAGGLTPVAAAEEPVRFIADIGESCINGSAVADLAFRLVQLGPTGKKLRGVDIVATGGFWSDCDGPSVRAGQTLEARKDGDAIHTFVVPALTVVPGRATDVLRGTAPGGQDVGFTLIHCFPGSTGCADSVTVAPQPVDADGHYTVDVGGQMDLRGGDIAIAHWIAPLGDDLYARTDAAVMEVRARKAVVFGHARPGSRVTIRLLSSGGALRAKGSVTVASFGGWSVTLKHDGKAVKARVGDRVTASFATDASLKVRAVELTANLGAGTLQGVCQPHGEVGVRAQTADFGSAESKHTTADGTGAWNTSGWTVLEHGSRVDVWCATTKGDVQSLTRTIP